MADKHLARASDRDWAKAFHGRHPFNPNSEMRMIPLGAAAGLQRIGVNLVRLPPGKESFIPHAHTAEEEFVFVLEGRGTVRLDGRAHEIGPGDFVGFPTDGVVHSLANTGEDDLVYLTGGERKPIEVAAMPTIGKTAVFRDNRISLFGADGVIEMTAEEWFARTVIPPDERA